MNTFPLKSINIKEAMDLQFKIVNEMTKVFSGHEMITRGDLGVTSEYNKPAFTKKAERVIAEIFDAEGSLLVRGAGTGAIRYALFSVIKPGETLLVHQAPIYQTTQTSIEMMGLKIRRADFNQPEQIRRALKEDPEIKAALVQYTRQSLDDTYEMEDVIREIKQIRDIPVVTDDNYAVMKVARTGSQLGADLSCFSTFKLLGPEGIGCIIGKKRYLDFIEQHHYSGGSQTQGFEALAVLQGLTYAPVSLAVQAKVNDELAERLNRGEIAEVKSAYLANAQSKVLLVELRDEIAEQVLFYAEQLGAAPNPIGAESKYELVPMFYRLSGTMRAATPNLSKRIIRINPMRSGADTVMRILKESIERSQRCS